MLQPLCPEIWCAHADLPMPGGLVCFPLTMTVVRLPDGGLVLVSPIAIDDALAEALAAVGTVAHIVAPNCFHHLYAAAAKARYPEARLYAAPGLKEKVPALPVDVVLDETAPAAWRDVMDQVCVAGVPRMNEVVFYHKPSRTLIVTDLLFHIHRPKGLLTGLMLRLTGTFRRPAQSRVWRLLTKDRAAAAASVRALTSLTVERLVPAHGEPVTDEAGAVLARGLAWMLRG